MKPRFLKTATLLALALGAALAAQPALADDPPARVGRIALTQGEVSISAGPGDSPSSALVNWPLTSENTVTTAPGARTELRVGSTAIRLDGDSALEVVQLDDDNLRLRLHYGSASIRIVNADVLPGFELATPQGRVLLQEPGRLRVDAGRDPDTSSVNVFDGVAIVEGGGERLTVRAGRRADIEGLDLRTTQAVRDAFDDWAAGRDRADDAVLATRYIPPEMTGYEELDRYGSWSNDSEYGTLWMPSVASDWVPYRDGRWTWIAPWGWTWVDNAPWGYAPFHYGRWVHVNRRWAWAPGRHDRHPVWSPALVGWVGGSGWNLNFNARPSPGQGWYPLAPHERYVPGYRLSDERLRRLNWQGWRDRDGKKRDYRREGLTVVPQDRFNRRGEVVVPREPRATPPANWQRAPVALPPTPPVIWHSGGGENRRAEDRDGRRDWLRGDRRGAGPAPQSTPVLGTQPAPVAASTQPNPQPNPQPGVITTAPPAFNHGADVERRREARAAFEDARRQRYQQQAESGGAVGVIGAPAPRPAMPVPTIATEPAPPSARHGGGRPVFEAAEAMRAQQAMRMRQEMRAQQQAQQEARAQQVQETRPAPVAVAPPPPRAMPGAPRAMPTPSAVVSPPPPVSAPAPARTEAAPSQPRHIDSGMRRGVPRQMER
jgi:hypothetical protein